MSGTNENVLPSLYFCSTISTGYILSIRSSGARLGAGWIMARKGHAKVEYASSYVHKKPCLNFDYFPGSIPVPIMSLGHFGTRIIFRLFNRVAHISLPPVSPAVAKLSFVLFSQRCCCCCCFYVVLVHLSGNEIYLFANLFSLSKSSTVAITLRHSPPSHSLCYCSSFSAESGKCMLKHLTQFYANFPVNSSASFPPPLPLPRVATTTTTTMMRCREKPSQLPKHTIKMQFLVEYVCYAIGGSRQIVPSTHIHTPCRLDDNFYSRRRRSSRSMGGDAMLLPLHSSLCIHWHRWLAGWLGKVLSEAKDDGNWVGDGERAFGSARMAGERAKDEMYIVS